MLRFKRTGETTFRSWRRGADTPAASESAADVSRTATVNASESLDARHTEPTMASPYTGWHARSVAGRIRRAWKALVADSPWPAMHAASHIFTAGILLYRGGVAFLYDSHFSWRLRHGLGISGMQLITQIWLWGALFVIPVLAGARMGTKFPRRGALGTLFALAIMTIIGSPFFLGVNSYTNANLDITKFLFSRENYVITDLINYRDCF